MVVYLKQESATLRDVIYVRLPQFIYLFRYFTHLLPRRPPFLLVIECKIPENPLVMCCVQDFANELSYPLICIDSVVAQCEILVLDIKSKKCLDPVVPWKSGHLLSLNTQIRLAMVSGSQG